MSSPRRDRATIAVLAGSGMLTSLQFTLIVPALSEVPAALGIGADDATWMVTITLLTGTVGTPIIGRLADMYGRRRLLLFSLACLFAGSLLAALWLAPPTALVGRALQGMSTAIIPVGISLLRDLVSRERANFGIALISGTLGIGSALGLPLSGVLSTLGGLPAIFAFSSIASAAFLLLVIAFVDESPVRTPGRFDVVGSIALTVALTCLLLLISKSLSWADAAPWAVTVLICVGLVATAVWVLVGLRHPAPVIDLRTSFRRRVLLTNVATFFAAFGMFANHLLTMQEARTPVASGAGLGLAPFGAGLVLVPSALAMVLLAPAAGRLLSRAGGRIALALGSAVIAGAYVLRLLVHDGLFVVVISATLVGVGTAFAFAAMPTLIIDAVPPIESASATAVNSLVRSLSGATASAVFAYLIVAHPSPVGTEYLSEGGFMIAFGLVALLSALGTLIALALPRSRG